MSLQTTQITDQILQRLQAIAVEHHHCNVGCSMLMQSILENAEQLITFIAQYHHINFTELQANILSNVDEKGSLEGGLEYDAEVYAALNEAQRYAEEAAGGIVAPEHLLWGLATTENEVAVMLMRYGITQESLIKAIRRYRNEPEEEEANVTDSLTSAIPTIVKFSTDMLKFAREDKIESAIGRDDEIRRILRALCRKNKNNPVLVGPPGTGKTAIIDGVAHCVIRGEVPDNLKRIRLFSLDFTAINAECKQPGDLEQILKKIVSEATAHEHIVLFIDEIHNLVAPNNCGGMNAANILKPEMARGNLRIIGATTIDEYTKYIESDKAFERRIQKIVIEEPDEEEAIAILRGVKKRYEEHHCLKIEDSAVVAAVQLSMRYITDRFLPDKALDLLDEAGSTMRTERESRPEELDRVADELRRKEIELEAVRSDVEHSANIPDRKREEIAAIQMEVANLRESENLLRSRWTNECCILAELQRLENERVRLLAEIGRAEESRDYSRVVALQREEATMSLYIAQKKDEQMAQTGKPLLKRAMDEEEIREVVSIRTGIPVKKMSEDEREKFCHMQAFLEGRVVGQTPAAEAVSKVIRRNRRGLGDEGKPIGTFLFLGTTGVGKTALAKALAEFLFDSPDMMVRIDMSEYQQEHSVARLFGAPPGYVGYDQGGQLTEAVRHKPYSVVLFDEIEKAHPKVFQSLLQVLDEGRMTDGQGRVVNFKNTVIIMTSNIGQDVIAQHITPLGMSVESAQRVKAEVLQELKTRVSPEFLNRINEIVLFRPLLKSVIREIVKLQMKGTVKKFASKNIDITYDDAVIDFLTEEGYEPEYGARPVARAINQYVTDEIVNRLDDGTINEGTPVRIGAQNGKLVFMNSAV